VRILLVIHHQLDEGYGAPGATLQLGRAYADLGHDVSYLSFDDLPPLPALAKEALFPEIAALLLRRATREKAIDLIDASTGDAWLWARMTRGRRPLLITRSHGLEHRYWTEAVAEARQAGAPVPRRTALYHGRLRLWEVAESLRAADVALLLNRADRDLAVEQLGVASERAHVVANGLSRSLLGRPLAPVGDPPAIAHIGSWAERKGVRYLVPAVSEVLRRHPTATISLLGTRRPANAIRAEFAPALHDRIAVVPEYEQANLPDLVAGHRIAVSASLAERLQSRVARGDGLRSGTDRHHDSRVRRSGQRRQRWTAGTPSRCRRDGRSDRAATRRRASAGAAARERARTSAGALLAADSQRDDRTLRARSRTLARILQQGERPGRGRGAETCNRSVPPLKPAWAVGRRGGGR